jgi:hypothetical protein
MVRSLVLCRATAVDLMGLAERPSESLSCLWSIPKLGSLPQGALPGGLLPRFATKQDVVANWEA